MDVTFSNVLEGTRQYFMGLPKAQGENAGQSVWPVGAIPPEEGATAQSGAPTPSSRPPSTAASAPTAPPPRPPSEPLEPEPHIIHKATVMREAAEKRREQPDPEDDEEPADALSPPSHIIHKPATRALPSPAPAPAAPCPSPARPPSTAPTQLPPPASETQPEASQYRPPLHRVQTPTARPPDHFAPGRPPDPYSVSRPPESYLRYHYENLPDTARNSHGQPVTSPQSSLPQRQSPQTYVRMSNSMPQPASRLRESAVHSPPTQRHVMPAVQPPPLLNDRVPPIHHPQVLPPQRAPPLDSRSAHYPPVQHRELREPSPYSRATSQYDRHPTLPQRKYDPQQAYPGYRPAPAAPHTGQTQRVEEHHRVQYKHPPTHVGIVGQHYPSQTLDRGPVPPSQLHYHHEASRHSHELVRRDYPNINRTADTRSNYNYSTPSTSAVRYAPSVPSAPVAPVPVVQGSSALPSRTTQRATTAPNPKSNYEYQQSNHVQTSPVRSTVKPGCPNQQARMTVSVTTLVSQMNQTKQKRESPLDLSVKTVKNSADSSTTQDDVVDSASVENKIINFPQRATTSSRHVHPTMANAELHKVDFAPDFTQYRERSDSQSLSSHVHSGQHTVRYNGAYDPHRPVEAYPVEHRHHVYPERSKYSALPGRPEYVPRIDLTKPVGDGRRPDQRIRDDRHFVIEERKRPSGPIISNIPEKIVRYETWSADSRIDRDRLSQSMREQQELMSRPVYSYSSHKQFEAYQDEQKRAAFSSVYRDHHLPMNQRYPYPAEALSRERSECYTQYDRNLSNSSRHVIQKIPSHRDVPPRRLDPHSGVPADKRVLSILRNSLETKQTYVEPPKLAKQISDLIVIDDVDDDIEITDLTKDNEVKVCEKLPNNVNSQKSPRFSHHIQMPKAVDSLPRDSDYTKNENPKSKSPENDVTSRIRTKGELKVLPPSHDNHNMRPETKQGEVKLTPKSQKQHLFNQIRQDSLRFESVIKSEISSETIVSEVKAESMNIDEIEKDAEVPIKTENLLEHLEPENSETSTKEEDLDWVFACDSFMEQLKSGCHKKKSHRKRAETSEFDNETNSEKIFKIDGSVTITETADPVATNVEGAPIDITNIVIKQEPIDEDDIKFRESNLIESEIKNIQASVNKSNSEITESSTNLEPPKDSSIENQEFNKDVDPDLTDIEGEPIKKSSQSISEKDEVVSKKTLLISKNKIKIKKAKDSNKIKKPSMIDDEKEKRQSKVKRSSNFRESDHKESLKNKTKKDSVKTITKIYKLKNKKTNKVSEKSSKQKPPAKTIVKSDKSVVAIKEEKEEKEPTKTVIKEELESTDDDEPLIKSKIMKEKEMKYQLLKDLSEKSAYVKLECFDVDMNKNTRISIDSLTKDKDDKPKFKSTKVAPRSKGKSLLTDNTKNELQNDGSLSSDDDVKVVSRLRARKNIKIEEVKTTATNKILPKSSPKKQDTSGGSSRSTPVRKAGFGDGSDFHPGWEEELYRYKRSLRMPTRLIAIPRGRSGGPFPRGSGAFFSRGSTSLPDLDPAPLSPAPSLAPSAATDDFYARRADKLALDSDLDSNSSCSAANRLQYDSEASNSTVFSSSNMKKKSNSIVDVLIQKCGKKDDSKKKSKDKEDKTPKIIPKSTNPNELLPTPSLGLVKNGSKGSLSAKKEKLMEDIFYLGAFRKETVSAFRNAFISNTDGLIGATEEFAPVVLKSRTRTESRVLKQRATIKEVFGDERPASAPPMCREEDNEQDLKEHTIKEIKNEQQPKQKVKPKKIVKDKRLRRSSSIRDGLRSTKSLKRNDAKGRMLRLKKRNSLIKSLNNKRMKDIASNRVKKDKVENDDIPQDKTKPKEETSTMSTSEGNTKRRLKRLFGRRKFSSGFDYIRKKKKIIRRDETPNNRIRRPAVKPSPESVHDIHKEIKGWFINKSIGETHLHRAARLGYTDCVAYCLEKMESNPSAKDNAGFTPLHFAASEGHVRIARLLLQYGANVSAAAQGGIRPLHEACENGHVEVIRLLLAYGADPLLGTYAGQTPEELTEGQAAMLLRLHIADVQGLAIEPWRFPPPTEFIDYEELGCNPLSSPPPASPPPAPDATVEIQCTDAPLPPFYSLKAGPGQPADGLWCLLQDITNLLQIKSKDSLLKQIHCGSGSPKELLREIRTQEFLERAQCHQLLSAGEKVNVRASKVALVRVTDKLRQLLKIETVLVS